MNLFNGNLDGDLTGVFADNSSNADGVNNTISTTVTIGDLAISTNANITTTKLCPKYSNRFKCECNKCFTKFKYETIR